MDIDPVTQAYAEDCLQWQCTICNIFARDQLGLQEEEFAEDLCVYTDRFDGSKWVKCDKCNHSYHLQCVTSDSEDKVAKQRFYCTFMGCKQ